jgi:adenosine deaminase
MPPATLLALARRNGIALPASDEAGLRRWFRFRDFDHFVEVYVTCSRCLRAPEDFHRLALDFVAEQARQNVTYSEVHFTISTHLAFGGDGPGIAQALAAAAVDAEERHGSRLRLIPDIVRNMELERADRTIEWAVATDRAHPGLIAALGIGGIEAGYSNEPFVEHFEAAARAGLRRVAHAGEHGGPSSIRSALDLLGAERLDHGVRGVEDPALMALLAESQVPLDVCPSSNVELGICSDLASHPFERLRTAGLAVNVSSDDPPFFGTTLSEEYLRLAETFGYGEEVIAELVDAAWQAAFLSDGERVALRGRSAISDV